jgi:integrating conjugative element relaxase (TIGR03760 family)
MSIFRDMSKNFQNFVKDNKNLNNNIAHKDPTPILSADILLATEKRQQCLTEIRNLLSLPDEEFNRVFQIVTENFAEFVQNLPETERSYYAGTGGMLDHALERASLSLFLCRTYLLPQDATLSSVSESEMLWVYALYTAALVYDIGRLATSHIVTLTDQKGHTLKSWQPFNVSMTEEKASHYVYGFKENHYDHMRWQVTVILALKILPKEGFNWIAGDMAVLESWLGLLSDDHRQVSPLLTIIQLVESLLQEGFYTGKKTFRNDLSPQNILAIKKMAKDRKEFTDKQKELKEKMQAGQVEKNKNLNKENQHTEKKDKVVDITKQADSNKKSTKRSFLDSKSVTSSDALKTATAYVIGHSDKEIVGKFIDWLKQNESHLKSDNAISRVEKGAIVDQKIIEKFITDSRLSSLNADQVKQALMNEKIAMPVDYAAVVAGQQTGKISAALQFSNPFLVFYTGIPPISINGVTATVVSTPVQTTAPQVQTAPESYQQQVKADAKQPQVQQQPSTSYRSRS